MMIYTVAGSLFFKYSTYRLTQDLNKNISLINHCEHEMSVPGSQPLVSTLKDGFYTAKRILQGKLDDLSSYHLKSSIFTLNSILHTANLIFPYVMQIL